MLQISTQIINSVQDGVAIDLSTHMSGTTIGISLSHKSECIYGNTATGLRTHMDDATIDLRAFMSNSHRLEYIYGQYSYRPECTYA